MMSLYEAYKFCKYRKIITNPEGKTIILNKEQTEVFVHGEYDLHGIKIIDGIIHFYLKKEDVKKFLKKHNIGDELFV